ncbi:MAG: HD domain-containing protein [Candidatus Eisenbacteria bacterium]|nr:HD domain-containing protein [Candidatus Eisenbacteria bacterium]
MKDARKLLEVLLECNQLKTIPRMGWRVRGVREGESVAEHSYAVALMSMMLADRLGVAVDREKVLRIALLHDLPEHVTGDIHAPATKILGEGVKEEAEARVMERLFADLPGGSQYVSLWREFVDRSSVEGRLVRAVDKLEMFTQAYEYELEGNRRIEDFWGYDDNTRDFAFDEVRELYDALRSLRSETIGR